MALAVRRSTWPSKGFFFPSDSSGVLPGDLALAFACLPLPDNPVLFLSSSEILAWASAQIHCQLHTSESRVALPPSQDTSYDAQAENETVFVPNRGKLHLKEGTSGGGVPAGAGVHCLTPEGQSGSPWDLERETIAGLPSEIRQTEECPESGANSRGKDHRSSE